MIVAKRSFDYPLINSIIKDPNIYPNIIDDYSPPSYEFNTPESNSIYYILLTEGESLLGLIIFNPQSTILYEFHLCLLPIAKGKGKICIKEAIVWIWLNTFAIRITISIPITNKVALKVIKQVGLKEYGINEKSFMKGGILRDQVLFGVSK